MLEWLANHWLWNLLWGFLAVLVAFASFFLAGGLAFLSASRSTIHNSGFFSSFVSLGFGGCLMLLSTLVAGFFLVTLLSWAYYCNSAVCCKAIRLRIESNILMFNK